MLDLAESGGGDNQRADKVFFDRFRHKEDVDCSILLDKIKKTKMGKM